MDFKDKVVVVTGAGSGMGRELTVQLVAKGAKVAMVDISESGLKETAKLAGEDHVTQHNVNVADKNAVESFSNEAITKHGQIDVLINNAGIIQPFIDVHELGYDKIDRIMDINFYGTLYMTKAFLPHLLERSEAYIANISSMGGFIPFPGQTFYGASKAAVKLLTEGLYAELKETNVGVSIIFPGAVNTNITSNSGVKTKEEEEKSKEGMEGRALSAKKAAEIIIKGIEKENLRILVGNDAKFLDILYRVFPRKAIDVITKQMSKLKL